MRLIVNADDAGIDAGRNQGIFQAIDQGVVRSISVIVGQHGWDDFLKRIKGRANISIGLHFNLTTGKPKIDTHKTIVDGSGRFHNKIELFKKTQKGLVNPREVSDELTAQFESLQQSGIRPTHIDGHNHIHILPCIAEGVTDVVPDGMWVRVPLEGGVESLDPEGKDPFYVNNNTNYLMGVLNFYSLRAKEIWKDKFHYVDDFVGTKITSRPTLTAFRNAIDKLNGDICELMCHPGQNFNGQASCFSKLKDRQIESEILTSKELKLFLKKRSIQIVCFRNV